MLFWSASIGGFLDNNIWMSLPEDAVAIAVELHADLMAQQAAGKRIVTGTDGLPTAVDPLPPPPPSLSQQADAELAARIVTGIAITCNSDAALSTTYALDDTTMKEVGAVARDFSTGLGLPGSAETFTYPDAGGAPRTFTGAQLCELYRAQRDLIFGISLQAATMAHGGTPIWPAQSATIA